MTALLDMLGLIICIIGGLWLWSAIRKLGIGGLASLVLTLTAFWISIALIVAMLNSIIQAFCRWLALLDGLGFPLILMIAGVGVALLSWRAWLHWRARRFFDV
jgi:hypothetical protein